jgi:hypothetical protein
VTPANDLVARLRAVSTTEIVTMYELTREAAKRISALEKGLRELERATSDHMKYSDIYPDSVAEAVANARRLIGGAPKP